MTKKELHDSIVGCITLSDPPYPTVKIAKLVDAIWGQPFDGETEKIAKLADLVTKSASLPKPKLAHLVTKSVSLPNQKPVGCEGHCRGDARCTGVIQEVTIRDCSGKFGHYNYCHPAIVSQRLSGYIVEVVNPT